MPVARSVSATQLASGGGGVGGGGGGGGGVVILAPKAHTLDSRYATPSMMNGHGEPPPRRKRPFMSFRLSKKSSSSSGTKKHKEHGGGGGLCEVDIGGGIGFNNNNNSINNIHRLSATTATIENGGGESVDGGSDSSSSASVKPKKKYLTRVSSFVSRVASKVQGSSGVISGGGISGSGGVNSGGGGLSGGSGSISNGGGCLGPVSGGGTVGGGSGSSNNGISTTTANTTTTAMPTTTTTAIITTSTNNNNNNNSNTTTNAMRVRLERSKTISVTDMRTSSALKSGQGGGGGGGDDNTTNTIPAPPAVPVVEFREGSIPGVMGIRNHGNTCFINAVIQCLSHTDVLAEYFVLDQYKHDLARCNKINSKKYGTRGEITEQLATLLKSLWTLRYLPDLSMNFKNTVDKYESLYRGSQQHDAAEFLMFVLDKVHEDLNTASKRKYKKIKNTYGRPDDIVAAETLANHLRCNSSFIQEIFQAQFRSSLKCPHCQKESNTFDPFVCVSIPIPQRQMQAVFVCVVYLNQQPKQVQLGLSIETTATIQDLRQQLAEDCGIPAESLIITEVDGEGFHRTLADGSPVTVIGESDPLYAIELPPHKPPTQESGAFVLVTWVNVVLADPENIRFGGVYQSQVVRDVTYVDLQKLLLKEMTNMVTNETLTSEQESGLFLIGVDDGGSCVVCLDPALDVPLFHECVEQALALCDPAAGPPHIKLVLQWTNQTKEKYIVDAVDHVDEHFSVKELKENPQQCASVSLHQCLQLHTSAEKLGCGDAWHCPTCNRKQQVVKRLMLWSAPQILVIHLKRFRQGTLQSNSSKLSTTVKFPLSGFDISDHVASKPNHTHTNGPPDSGVLGGVWSPWKRPKRCVTYPEENVYDLYAVCYHHGKDMQGGHYTAMCKNTADNKWYNFDDSKVEVASEEQVISPDAYILFYQRRSDNGTQMSSSDGGQPEHWSFRIPLTYLPPALSLPAAKENKVPAPSPAPFERGRSYGTLPVGVRGQRQSSTEREHASDTEAPLASHEESPLLKRRSTSTLLEKDDSPTEETPPITSSTNNNNNNSKSNSSSLKVETIRVEVVASKEDKEEKKEEEEEGHDDKVEGDLKKKKKNSEDLEVDNNKMDCDVSSCLSSSSSVVVNTTSTHNMTSNTSVTTSSNTNTNTNTKPLFKTIIINRDSTTDTQMADGTAGVRKSNCNNSAVTTNANTNTDTKTNSNTSTTTNTTSTNTTTNSSSGKTVLISRCQAMRESDLPEVTLIHSHARNNSLTNGHVGASELVEEDEEEEEEQEEADCNVEEDRRRQERTPEVRIHPATPEVLAAHQSQSQSQSQTDGQSKRSVITLTLRPRHSSESSCEAKVVSRTSSQSSNRSSSSSVGSGGSGGGTLVNGVVNGEPYQNGTLDDDPHSSVTPEIRITPMAKNADIPGSRGGTGVSNGLRKGSGPIPAPVKVSTRCQNANKTASYVVINTPTASPRAPRPKTPIIPGYNTSSKPYSSSNSSSSYNSSSSKVTIVKVRDPSLESLRNQRTVSSRREGSSGGIASSTKVPLTNGKGPSISPSPNYYSPMKGTTTTATTTTGTNTTNSTTIGSRSHRTEKEKGELRYLRETRCGDKYERREQERYDMEKEERERERYDGRREERYETRREDRYEARREDKYDKREDNNRYARREENGSSSSSSNSSSSNGSSSSSSRYERDHHNRYKTEKHFRDTRRHNNDDGDFDYNEDDVISENNHHHRNHHHNHHHHHHHQSNNHSQPTHYKPGGSNSGSSGGGGGGGSRGVGDEIGLGGLGGGGRGSVRCSIDFRELREAWCKREYDYNKYEDDSSNSKCDRIYRYETDRDRDVDHTHQHGHHHQQYSHHHHHNNHHNHHHHHHNNKLSREGRYEREGEVLGKGRTAAPYDTRDLYRPKGLLPNSTAITHAPTSGPTSAPSISPSPIPTPTPAVITESSV